MSHGESRTAGLARRRRTLPEAGSVRIRRISPSRTTQTGVATGLPSRRNVVSEMYFAAPRVSRSGVRCHGIYLQIYSPHGKTAQTAAAVLGALSIEPMTGYEIRQAITSVLGHFWHESFGQIYPCLADLEGQGPVASTPGARPRSTTYVLTDAGRARLRELLEEPPVPQPPRNGTLLRVFFGASLPPEVLAALLDELEARCGRGWPRTPPSARASRARRSNAEHHPYWLATVRAGELGSQAPLQWLAETRATLQPPATLSPS